MRRLPLMMAAAFGLSGGALAASTQVYSVPSGAGPHDVAPGTSPGLVWDRARLEAFLQEPDNVVPGTVMARPPLALADERRLVLDYLETVRR